jgi:hypothetical protein
MEKERWKKENGNEDLTLYLSWKEREIDGEMFYYLFCKKNRISTSSMGKRNLQVLIEKPELHLQG